MSSQQDIPQGQYPPPPPPGYQPPPPQYQGQPPNYVPPPLKRSPLLPILVAIVVFAVVFAGFFFLMPPSEPVYRQYDTSTTVSGGLMTTIYRNQELGARIVVTQHPAGEWPAYTTYSAYRGEEFLAERRDVAELYDVVASNHAHKLTDDQLKWFEHVCLTVLD